MVFESEWDNRGEYAAIQDMKMTNPFAIRVRIRLVPPPAERLLPAEFPALPQSLVTAIRSPVLRLK